LITDNFGSIMLGSANLQISMAGVEILTGNPRVLNFSIIADNDYHITINGGTPIFIRGSQILLVPVVNSVSIVEAGITYNWNGQKG